MRRVPPRSCRTLRLPDSRVSRHGRRPVSGLCRIGGKPLMRRDLPALIRLLAAKPGLTDLALTTNGVLLADQIDALGAAGIGRITVSLETLRRDRFEKLTRYVRLDAVLEGINAASIF